MSYFGKNKLRELSAAELSTIFSKAINEHFGLVDKVGETTYECTINSLEFNDSIGAVAYAAKMDISFRESYHYKTANLDEPVKAENNG